MANGETPNLLAPFSKSIGLPEKPPLPVQPLIPFPDNEEWRRHRTFVKEIAHSWWFWDLAARAVGTPEQAGKCVGKDFMLLYGLNTELNQLEVGETKKWYYWPTHYDHDDALVYDAGGPYTLEIKRTAEPPPDDVFENRGNSNYGWCYCPYRKMMVWQKKS